MYMRASCAKYSSSGDNAISAAARSAAWGERSFFPATYTATMSTTLADTENARSAKAESPSAEIHILRSTK
jgi:hypothetical protein